MYTQKQNEQPSVLKLLLTIGSVMVLGVLAAITIGTGDMLWFWWKFEETPQKIVVNCYGEVHSLEQGDPAFSSVNASFNKIFSGQKNWDTLGLSAETWEQYQQGDEGITVMLQYAEPIRVHSMYKYFSNIETLIIPLEGRHANSYAVFGIAEDNPSAGALHVKTLTPLQQSLTDTHICEINLMGSADIP